MRRDGCTGQATDTSLVKLTHNTFTRFENGAVMIVLHHESVAYAASPDWDPRMLFIYRGFSLE